MTLEDVQMFHSKLFDHVYIKALVHGNMAPEQAVQLKDDIDTILDFGALDEKAANAKQKLYLLDGPYAYVYHLFNEDEEDSTIFNSYQVVYLK